MFSRFINTVILIAVLFLINYKSVDISTALALSINSAIIILYFSLEYSNENFDQASGSTNALPLSNEALQNIASVYNNKDLVVNNLRVTGTLKSDKTIEANYIGSENLNTKNIVSNSSETNTSVAKTATIGNWNIRNDAIGIPGRMDIRMDDWVRINQFGTLSYSPNGIASRAFSESPTQNNENSELTRNNTVNNLYVRYGANIEARPNLRSHRCFDFGSSGNKECTHPWVTARIHRSTVSPNLRT
jgi:hypothetical protein